MSGDVSSESSAAGRGVVKRKVYEVLLERFCDGVTLDDILKILEEEKKLSFKKDSVYRALHRGVERGEVYVERSSDGKYRYFHSKCRPVLECWEEVVKRVLSELHEEFLKTPLAGNPWMNRMVTPGFLAGKVVEAIREEGGIKDWEEEKLILDGVERLLTKNQGKIQDFIRSRGLRVRIGGINYP